MSTHQFNYELANTPTELQRGSPFPSDATVLPADELATQTLSDRVEQLADGLEQRGVGVGARVGILMTSKAEFLEATLALDRLRALAVAVDHRLPPNAVVDVLSQASLGCLLVDSSMLVVGSHARSQLPYNMSLIVIAETTPSGVAPRIVSCEDEREPSVEFLCVAPRGIEQVFDFLSAGGHGVDGAHELAEALLPAGAAEAARRADEERRRQHSVEASAQITRRLLSSESDPLRVISRWVQQIADADAVNILIPNAAGDQLEVKTATGAGAELVDGLTYAKANTLSELVLDTGQPQLIADIAALVERGTYLSRVVPIGPVMMLPLISPQGVIGAFVVARLEGRVPFTAVDLEMATTFAAHAAVALELSEARKDRQQVVTLQDRDRTARALHDLIIQRLFGAGMTVESIASRMSADRNAARLGQVITDIDETIREIRHATF